MAFFSQTIPTVRVGAVQRVTCLRRLHPKTMVWSEDDTRGMGVVVHAQHGMVGGQASGDGGGGDDDDDDEMVLFDAEKKMEHAKEYLRNTVFGGGWRDHGTRGHRGGVMSSSVNRGLSDVVTRLDTLDAMEACQGLAGEDKAECYVVFGVDRDADMWYDIVSTFDALLGLDTDPLEESVHGGQERV